MADYLQRVVGRIGAPLESQFAPPVEMRADALPLDGEPGLDDPFDQPLELPPDAPTESILARPSQQPDSQSLLPPAVPIPAPDVTPDRSPTTAFDDQPPPIERDVMSEIPAAAPPRAPLPRFEQIEVESPPEHIQTVEPIMMPPPDDVRSEIPPEPPAPEIREIPSQLLIQQIIQFIASSNAETLSNLPPPAPLPLPTFEGAAMQMVEPPEQMPAEPAAAPSQIVIGDVVVEITNPSKLARPAVSASSSSTPRPPKPVRGGVPSKRRFGIGQS